MEQVPETVAVAAPYQVFINHRGPDVKKSLASLIYHRLTSYGLSVFLDKNELRTGDIVSPAILDAIQSARFMLPSFLSVTLNRVGAWMNWIGFWDHIISATPRLFPSLPMSSLRTFVVLRASVMQTPLKITNTNAESPWKSWRNGRQPSTKRPIFLACRLKRMKGESILHLLQTLKYIYWKLWIYDIRF